jgi:hypothetical protein
MVADVLPGEMYWDKAGSRLRRESKREEHQLSTKSQTPWQTTPVLTLRWGSWKMCIIIFTIGEVSVTSSKPAKMIGVIASHDSGVYCCKKQPPRYYYCHAARYNAH